MYLHNISGERGGTLESNFIEKYEIEYEDVDNIK